MVDDFLPRGQMASHCASKPSTETYANCKDGRKILFMISEGKKKGILLRSAFEEQ